MDKKSESRGDVYTQPDWPKRGAAQTPPTATLETDAYGEGSLDGSLAPPFGQSGTR